MSFRIDWGGYFVFLLLIHKASLEMRVVALPHSTVTLQCLSNDGKLRSQSAEIYWRYEDSKTVLDIQGGRISHKEQHSMFRGRVDSFPEQHTKGNFSITLRDVTLADTGLYTCFMPQVLKQTKIHLIVKDSALSPRFALLQNTAVRIQAGNLLPLYASLFLLVSICTSLYSTG